MFRTLVLFLSFLLVYPTVVDSTRDCIYDAAPFIYTMVTGSTGTYGGLEEAPELTMMLAKKEPEVDGSGSSYDTPD